MSCYSCLVLYLHDGSYVDVSLKPVVSMVLNLSEVGPVLSNGYGN